MMMVIDCDVYVCVEVYLFYLHGGVVCLFIYINPRLTQKPSIHHFGVEPRRKALTATVANGLIATHCGKV